MKPRPAIALTSLLAGLLLLVSAATAPAADRVILISVDGLRPDAVTALGPDVLPNFYRLRNEGAFTDNARTDFDHTVTLPNHTCMITGRRVEGEEGHNWTANGTPESDMHAGKGAYVASIFDVAHDAGLVTALYASKGKFSLFDDSYNQTNGAEHANGRDKIDHHFRAMTGSGYEITAKPAVERCVADLAEHTCGLTMLHILDPDAAGHHGNWMDEGYLGSIKRTDAMLGKVLDLVESDPDYAGKTTIILTADHGGIDGSHGHANQIENYTIPFYVWGADVTPGADLYQLNQDTRQDPGRGRIDYIGKQPIRNADAANLALSLLGLPPVPGSTINADQSLRTSNNTN